MNCIDNDEPLNLSKNKTLEEYLVDLQMSLEDLNAEYESFKNTFNKKYEADEDATRKLLFAKTLNEIGWPKPIDDIIITEFADWNEKEREQITDEKMS